MKIAVIGTGIAGNVVAHRLAREHEITVYEAADYIGGHTNTVDVQCDGREYAIDTGFIVYNDRTYPRFIRLLDELGVASQTSSMSFSVRCDRGSIEYNGASLDGLFAQRKNLLRPSFYRMIRDILRFNREAPALLHAGDHSDNHSDNVDPTLSEYLFEKGYSRQFVEHYILPMGAAIWSAEPGLLSMIPARFFVRFFANHGLLSLGNRPTWRVIRGGSRAYVEPLVAAHRDRIRLRSPVTRIRRGSAGVEISTADAGAERFDQVFIACHSDQALRLLADATPQEREVLGALRYEENSAVLHTDESLLPRRRSAWAAWNYHIPDKREDRVAVTYNMNILQGIRSQRQFCVTLNRDSQINPDTVIERFQYHHPVFTRVGVAAQRRHAELNGTLRTYYCGAYWGNGFHEDGVASADAALKHFGERNSVEKLHLRRTG